MRPYTRSLHPDDYGFLPYAEALRAFETRMVQNNVPYRGGQHEHRIWEYASIVGQFYDLQVPRSAKIVDVGSGGSFLPTYLSVEGFPNVMIVDSMVGGDITKTVTLQNVAFRIEQTLRIMSAENMSQFSDGSFDVTMCVSVLEHVAAERHDDAFRELCRITKPDGLIFLTSDYWRDSSQWELSPWKDYQHTLYTEAFVLDLPNRFPVDFVGETDLDYRGDFVHNYSFVNVCLRKRQHPLSGKAAVSTEKA